VDIGRKRKEMKEKRLRLLHVVTTKLPPEVAWWA
jgi:hypothetical protein